MAALSRRRRAEPNQLRILVRNLAPGDVFLRDDVRYQVIRVDNDHDFSTVIARRQRSVCYGLLRIGRWRLLLVDSRRTEVARLLFLSTERVWVDLAAEAQEARDHMEAEQ